MPAIMHHNKSDKPVLALSILLGLLVVVVSCTGLLTPGFYARETANWQAQSLGQDMVDLFVIVPCLIVASVATYNGSNTARMIWGGTVLYLTYTFVLYCFDVHFNRLFIVYCGCLGLSFYSVLYFLFTRQSGTAPGGGYLIERVVGWYFIVIAILFYFLWLMEVVPAMVRGGVPESIAVAGLPTNGVHALDLGIFLPGTFITGLLLLKKSDVAYVLTPALLTFFILMDITIGVLALWMRKEGVGGSPAVAIIMAVLTFISLILLILFVKGNKKSIDV